MFNILKKLGATFLLLSTVIFTQAEYQASAHSYALPNSFSYYGQQFAIEIAVINITPQTDSAIPASTVLLSLARRNPLDDNETDSIVNIGGDYEELEHVIQVLQKTVNVELLLPIHKLKTNVLKNLVHLELGNRNEPNPYSFTMEVFPRRHTEDSIHLYLELKSIIERTQTDSFAIIKDAQSFITSMDITDRNVIALSGFVKGHLIEFNDKKTKDNVVILIRIKLIDSESTEMSN